MDLNGKKRGTVLALPELQRSHRVTKLDRQRESLLHSFNFLEVGHYLKSSFIISASKKNSVFPLPVLMGKNVYHVKGNFNTEARKTRKESPLSTCKFKVKELLSLAFSCFGIVTTFTS